MNKIYKAITYRVAHVWCRLWPWPGFDTSRVVNHILKDKYLEVVKTLKKGDILLTKSHGFASNLILGEYTHAAIYVGNSFDNQYKHGVVHAIDPMATVEEFQAIATNISKLKVMRSNKITTKITIKDLDLVCKRAKNTVNKLIKYDYEFLSDASNPGVCNRIASKELYCSELVVFAYKLLIDQKKVEFLTTDRVNKNYYVPNDFTVLENYWNNILEVEF